MFDWFWQLLRKGYTAEGHLEVIVPEDMEVTVHDAPPMTSDDEKLLMEIAERTRAAGYLSDEDDAILDQIRTRHL